MGAGHALSAMVLLAIVLFPSVAGAQGCVCGRMEERAVAAARANITELASATARYVSHMGVVPPTLQVLTRRATNADGVSRGPFINVISLPPGWQPYTYTPKSDRGYRISTSGVAMVEAIGLGEHFLVEDDFVCGMP